MTQQKPSLLSAAPRPPAPGRRILTSLEHGSSMLLAPDHRLRWRLNSLTLGLGMLVALTGSLAWLVHRNADAPVAPLQLPLTSVPLNASPASRQAGAASTTVVSAPAPAITAPATIVESRLAMALPAPRQRAVSAPLPVQVQGKPAARTTLAAAAAHAPAHAKPTAADRRAPASARKRLELAPAPSAQPSDADVTLLTALVAHANQNPAATPSSHPRDVVERQDGDSTQALLLRCKLLGQIEGMLCRSRICYGRWDYDAACRAPSR